MKIAVVGGTGFAGSAIVGAAAQAGDEVISLARSQSGEPNPRVASQQLDVTDLSGLRGIDPAAQVVVVALSARGPMLGRVAPAVEEIARTVAGRSRLVVIGGFGSMRVSPGGDRVAQSDDFPAAARPEAREMLGIVEWLEHDAPSGLDWLYVSPAARFGALHSGEREGHAIVSGDVVETADSYISGDDFADAVVEEIHAHIHQGHISVRAKDSGGQR